MKSIELFMLPQDVAAGELSGTIAVAVDVLRASTTIVNAIASGAQAIYPVVDVPTAFQKATELRASSTASDVLLGGERDGVLIKGFDLSNSPVSYDQSVGGRQIVFTTTNGTLAIQTCQPAEQVLIGCFCNLTAISQHILRSGLNVAIVCAGTDGQPTMEDILFGGALIASLQEPSPGSDSRRGKDAWKLSTAAHSAAEIWALARHRLENGKSLAELLSQTQGGKNLVRLGFQQDIEFAAQLNLFDLVPVYQTRTGSIRSDVDLVGQHR